MVHDDGFALSDWIEQQGNEAVRRQEAAGRKCRAPLNGASRLRIPCALADAPTRLWSGERMERIGLDLLRAMLDSLDERAGASPEQRSEFIRAALVAAGVGSPFHISGSRT